MRRNPVVKPVDNCPVCGTMYFQDDACCPECGWSKSEGGFSFPLVLDNVRIPAGGEK